MKKGERGRKIDGKTWETWEKRNNLEKMKGEE